VWEGVEWIHLAQGKAQWRDLVNPVMNLRVPRKAGISWLNWTSISFSRRTLLHGVS